MGSLNMPSRARQCVMWDVEMGSLSGVNRHAIQTALIVCGNLVKLWQWTPLDGCRQVLKAVYNADYS